MPNVLHVGQFMVRLKEQEPTGNRVNDMCLRSKKAGELVAYLNERIREETMGGTANPSVTWREVVGVDNFMYGELYVYNEGLPEDACVRTVSAVQNICSLFRHSVQFVQYHKF